VIYALMDLGVDREQGIQSLPARFGARSGEVLPIAMHAGMTALLAIAGALAGAGDLFWAGPLAALGLIGYERRLFLASPNVFVLNERVFTANMFFSVLFLAATAAGFTIGR
jgi:4-hydroxybenzoate polyprenyltransferase